MAPSIRPVRRHAQMTRALVVAVVAAVALVVSGPLTVGSVSASEMDRSQVRFATETESTDGIDSTGTDSTDGTESMTGADSTETDSSATVETVGPGEPTTEEGSIVENPLGASDEDQEGSSAAEDRKIWAVIGGLLLVALALAVLTVRYWRQTKPAPRPAPAAAGGRRARSAAEPVAYDDLGSDLFVDEP